MIEHTFTCFWCFQRREVFVRPQIFTNATFSLKFVSYHNKWYFTFCFIALGNLRLVEDMYNELYNG